MYESPITLINKGIQFSLEDEIYKAVEQVDIKVDKDELIKALKYDRGQYEKGYEDAKAEQKKGRWIDYPISDVCLQCSCCGVLRMGDPSNYCPNCGAEMEE